MQETSLFASWSLFYVVPRRKKDFRYALSDSSLSFSLVGSAVSLGSSLFFSILRFSFSSFFFFLAISF